MPYKPVQPNPESYDSPFLHLNPPVYAYQRSAVFRITQVAMFIGFAVLEQYLVHYHKLDTLPELFILMVGAVIYLQVADYVLYKLLKHRA